MYEERSLRVGGGEVPSVLFPSYFSHPRSPSATSIPLVPIECCVIRAHCLLHAGRAHGPPAFTRNLWVMLEREQAKLKIQRGVHILVQGIPSRHLLPHNYSIFKTVFSKLISWDRILCLCVDVKRRRKRNKEKQG